MSDHPATSKKANIFLRPAFATRAQIIAFIVLVAAALALPEFIFRSGRLAPENSYEVMPERLGSYSYIKSQIFEEKEEIDVLFLGSSILWNAVDAPQVQRALSEKLGRPAVVRTFGFNFNSLDIPYTMLRDVLERRRVKMVILSIPRLPYTDGPSTTAYRFLRYGEDEELTDSLPADSRLSLYGSAVLRSPRDLVSMVRKNRSLASEYAENLGANKELLGMYREPKNFVRFAPSPSLKTASELFYGEAGRPNFHFTNEEIPSHQNEYLDAIVTMLRTRQIPLVMLNIPQYSERDSEKAPERFDWAERFGMPVPLIGISPPELFAGLTADEIEKLHCDREHFNLNGNEYFTAAVMPAILEAYEKNAIKTY